jgi:hypothetical protein
LKLTVSWWIFSPWTDFWGSWDLRVVCPALNIQAEKHMKNTPNPCGAFHEWGYPQMDDL